MIRAARPLCALGLGALHVYLGLVHLFMIAQSGATYEHVWKSAGAFAGAAYMITIGVRELVRK